jgi:glycerophosphoryl diester phosphodiesterase
MTEHPWVTRARRAGDRLTVFAHRGGAGLAPENTRGAFRNAAAMGVDGCELDVRLSKDGEVVVIHDATLDRTTDGNGPVASRSWAELQRLTLKGTTGERIMPLEDVVRVFRDTPITLRLELKANADRNPYPQVPGLVAGILQAESVLAKTIVTSFQIETLAAMRRAARPQGFIWLIANMVLADIGLDGVLATAKAYDIGALSIHHTRLDSEVVAKVRSAGLGIGGYGAHEDPVIRKMFDLALDVFTTDRPDRAIAIRTALP